MNLHLIRTFKYSYVFSKPRDSSVYRTHLIEPITSYYPSYNVFTEECGRDATFAIQLGG